MESWGDGCVSLVIAPVVGVVEPTSKVGITDLVSIA